MSLSTSSMETRLTPGKPRVHPPLGDPADFSPFFGMCGAFGSNTRAARPDANMTSAVLVVHTTRVSICCSALTHHSSLGHKCRAGMPTGMPLYILPPPMGMRRW